MTFSNAFFELELGKHKVFVTSFRSTTFIFSIACHFLFSVQCSFCLVKYKLKEETNSPKQQEKIELMIS
jgi:hypothetical protein